MHPNHCKFHNGDWHNTHCEAGIAYRDVTPDPDDINGKAFRKPCIIERDKRALNPGQLANYERRGTCDKFQLPTVEELAADDARHEARLKEVLESLEKGVVPEGVMVCGPGTVGACKCNCPESCEHVWDGSFIEDDENCISTATCSRCGKWAMSHDMWVEV